MDRKSCSYDEQDFYIERKGRIFSMGKSLIMCAKESQHLYDSLIVAAKINGEIHDLQTSYAEADEIRFVTRDSPHGWTIYRRSVLFLLIAAVNQLEKRAEVIAKFTVNKGLYCEIKMPNAAIEPAFIEKIEAQMREMIAANLPIIKRSISREDAIDLFRRQGRDGKVQLLSALSNETISIYTCEDCFDYLYGPMLYETGELGLFELDYEPDGVLIRTPDEMTQGHIRQRINQPKFGSILAESKEWADILECRFISDLNRMNKEHQIGELIRISEGLQEKRIAQIADHIAANQENIRIILIAGPSSSGKTSFAQRLRIQLRVNGLRPVMISLDDYFLNREDTPLNEKGEYDYESLDALDTKLFNENMLNLLAGREVQIPRYNFITGKREWKEDAFLAIQKDQPIIIEGIHGLNEYLTKAIPRINKYKIYISALTQLNIDAHNRIPTTEVRFLRRLVRDYQFRGAKALKSIRQWPDVRAGEEKYIFPFQEDADALFNSALIYEIGVLKAYAVPLLSEIKQMEEGYTEARLILRFLQYVDSIDNTDDIPNNSILREFIGKSVFFPQA
ncbi:phosphoribulokinase/uridine kinase family protein [Selenomonas sp. oral taxon 892 str. F0426]|nr:phosphoribulokinase/uridine kinase family protein [Selenomonas sp. oral taxon 892 str. F0426]